jgi:hypothetical protein
MNEEIWKPVVGFPLYEVSSHGRVRSWNNNRWGKRKTPKLLTLGKYRTGYLRVNIHSKYMSVHRLVCETFNPNPNNLPVVLHLDNDPTNNHFTNLKWGTQSENILQCSRERRHRHYRQSSQLVL